MDEQERRDIGARVKSTRRRRGLTKEGIARDVGISSITYKKIEDGLPVREDKLATVLGYLGLPIPGDDVTVQQDRSARQVIAEMPDITEAERAAMLAILDRAEDGGGEDDSTPISGTG